MTPLESILKEKIVREGPINIGTFMVLAMAHPKHGYYTTRDPLGAAGDFTTAPEISQMFGELLGLWAADVWTKLGRPAKFQLIECGPGRGTLMADALRALKAVPGFLEAADIVLVEIGAVLIEKQREALKNYTVQWVTSIEDGVIRAANTPVILLANELLDTFPVRQFRFAGKQWSERMVTWVDGAFEFMDMPCNGQDWMQARLAAVSPHLQGEAIVEFSAEREAFVHYAAQLLKKRNGAALFIDYGYEGPAAGDTLQALRHHQYVPVLSDIGLADITAHVDFGALRSVAIATGTQAHGPIDQGAFLRRLGIEVRAAKLNQPAELARLTGPNEMGRLFKVMAISGDEALHPEGF